jgi:hypothetical protein
MKKQALRPYEKMVELLGITIGASLFGFGLVPWWGMAIVMLTPVVFFIVRDQKRI